MGVPSQTQIELAHENPELQVAQAVPKSITDGLALYQLQPKMKMSLEEQLKHMIEYRKHDPKLKKGELSRPSSYLDVVVTDEQETILNPTGRSQNAAHHA
jgi:hypothetical protein